MIYLDGSDEAWAMISAVGTKAIDDFYCYLKVSPPGGETKSVRVKIGAPNSTPPDGQGAQHVAKFPGFRATFPSQPVDAPIGGYALEAYLDKAIGGDKWSGTIVDT
jgi:hypothetical protein